MPANDVRFDFSGCRVLVTGGTSGIGRAISHGFREAGADVVITGTRGAPSDYDDDFSGFRYHQLQMTDREAIAELAGSLDGLDVLVNNAGANFPGGMDEQLPEGFEESVAVNLFGTYRLSRACEALLKASELDGGASVINLASLSIRFAVPIVPGYGSAKAGVAQLTRNLAVAWAADGVRVNALAPGVIETRMTAPLKKFEALAAPQLQRIPMGRFAQPEEIAPAALFLASSGARYLTGQTVYIDGGYSVA